MRKENVAIIIPTYNQYELTRKNIILLKRQTLVPDIFVVDNNSIDNTYEKLKKEFGREIKLIRSNENNGCGFALKLGMEEAYKRNYTYFILSDNDAYPVSRILIESLLKKIKSNKNLGFVVPKNIVTDSPELTKEEEIESYMFHYYMIKREIIDKIGYPDPEYFLQGDDSDYSSRIISQGYVGKKINHVYYEHPFKSFAYISPIFIYYCLRNNLYFHYFWNKSLVSRMRTTFRILSETSLVIAFSKISKRKEMSIAINKGIEDFLKDKRGKNESIMKMKFSEIETVKEYKGKHQEKPLRIYTFFLYNDNVFLKKEDLSIRIKSKKKFKKIIYFFEMVKIHIKNISVYIKMFKGR